MNRSDSDPSRLLTQWRLIAALLTMVLLLSASILLFGFKDGLNSLLPDIIAGVLLVLAGFLLRWLLFRPTDSFLRERDLDRLAHQLGERLNPELGAPDGHRLYSWNALPWQELLAGAQELEFAVSYMDTWVNQTATPLKALLNRGGTIRVYLPKPGTLAAQRVQERFPEYSAGAIQDKIEGTASKLKGLLSSTTNKKAKIEFLWTEVFCMHCLMRVDRKVLIVSPFDHFRRSQIEGPALVVDLTRNPRWIDWMEKEFSGFRDSASGSAETFTNAASSKNPRPLPVQRTKPA